MVLAPLFKEINPVPHETKQPRLVWSRNTVEPKLYTLAKNRYHNVPLLSIKLEMCEHDISKLRFAGLRSEPKPRTQCGEIAH